MFFKFSFSNCLHLILSTTGLPDLTTEMFELENRWLRSMNYQPEPMTLLMTLFDDLIEVKYSLKNKRENKSFVRF